MIKLKNIVDEIIKSSPLDEEQDIAKLDEIIEACQEMGETTPTLWRGIQVANPRYRFVHVVQDRETFRGKNIGASSIMDYLKIKYPVFVFSQKRSLSTIVFGDTYVVVFKQPYRMFYSEQVEDVMTYASEEIYKTVGPSTSQIGTRTEKQQRDKALKAAKTYQQITLNDTPSIDHEIIVDAPNYWAVDVPSVARLAWLRGYENDSAVKTYGDVLKAVSAYKQTIIRKIRRNVMK